MENAGLFCDARTVPESQIEQVLIAAINHQTWCDKDIFLATLQTNIKAVLESEKGQSFTDIDKRLAELKKNF